MHNPHDNVRRTGESFIRKTGWSVHNLREAEALKFVRTNTSIPVPRVISVDVDDPHDVDTSFAHLTIEFIDGESLATAWPKMDYGQQQRVVSQLRSYISMMRKLPQPHPGWIESCSGGQAMDHRVDHGNPFGPMQSESDFHDYLLRRLEHRTKQTDRQEEYEAVRSRLSDHGPPVFTHADLGAEHILVNPYEGRIVGIIDWEMAGFWPQYWEYRKALYGYGCLELEGWQDIVNAVMTPYPKESSFVWGPSCYHSCFCTTSRIYSQRKFRSYVRAQKSELRAGDSMESRTSLQIEA